ncbi:MAG TPA: GIY-YIG nuclease family protein [Synechococcales cyanobacterium M55_K2018_004]|nr:GIY-YIG nuclease family protein [Synechococcales cyanobacterium M55_K2018_004]
MGKRRKTQAISGIYKITCTATGDCYVGKAVNINIRWAKHRRDLRQGRHHNKRLQWLWDQYNESYFRFEILEKCPPSVLAKREAAWIKVLGSTNKLRPQASRFQEFRVRWGNWVVVGILAVLVIWVVRSR